jgi:hypothetical protein
MGEEEREIYKKMEGNVERNKIIRESDAVI